MKPRTTTMIRSAVACLLLTACADKSEDYPTLLPSEIILAEPELPDQPVALEETTKADAAALEARAEALRQPVIDPSTRDRMIR